LQIRPIKKTFCIWYQIRRIPVFKLKLNNFSLNLFQHNKREFALKIKRPFAVRYNPYNQTIEILSNAQQVSNIITDVKGDICIVFDALKKMEETKDTNAEDLETRKRKNIKLIQKYKKLEEAFKNLSLDFPDDI
jgi:hypothetical protein